MYSAPTQTFPTAVTIPSDSMQKVEYEPGNVRFPIGRLREYFADKFTI